MTQGIYTVLSNIKLAPSVYRMELSGDTSALTQSGQFINFKIEGLYLRRPISVCDYSENTITVIYKVVGEGTEIMAKAVAGDTFDILVGLGNGFNTEKSGEKPLLIGGGVGIPPLYNLCKKLIANGKKVSVILGFNTKEEIFYENEFKALGAEVYVTTVDGSYGVKGFVTDAFTQVDFDYFYTCGPMPCLRLLKTPLQ